MRESTKRPKPEPHVGIFWLVVGKLLIASTALSEAERYGDNLTHPRAHVEVWEQFQQTWFGLGGNGIRRKPTWTGDVQHQDQSVHAAGRQVHSERWESREIMRRLGLPKATKIGTDDHVRPLFAGGIGHHVAYEHLKIKLYRWRPMPQAPVSTD
jgi:hypothetical protein